MNVDGADVCDRWILVKRSDEEAQELRTKKMEKEVSICLPVTLFCDDMWQ